MKLAIIGSRGFLTDYGGFETFTRELVLNLKEKGYDITVYGLKRYKNPENDKKFPEVKRVWIPSLKIKFLEKVVVSFLSTIHASFSKNKILLLLGVSPGLLLWLPRLMGKRIVINVDGIEWQRPKWSKFIAFFLRLSEAFASIFSDTIIADSKNIANYIIKKYKKIPVYIPYGADFNSKCDDTVLRKYNLKPMDYFLQVCRLEPENNSHVIIREYLDYKRNKKLVIIGDTPHSIGYKESLKKMADERVKFLGGLYGKEYKVILRNAYCYIHGHEAGGTNPALLEAMASGKCVVVLDVPYNLEVIEDCGISFSKKEGKLLHQIERLDKDGKLVSFMGQKALIRVKKFYTWGKVIFEYDQVIKGLF